MSKLVVAPGATGRGRSMRTTLRSVFGPPSGCTNVHFALAPSCRTLSRRMKPYSPSLVATLLRKPLSLARFSVMKVLPGPSKPLR